MELKDLDEKLTELRIQVARIESYVKGLREEVHGLRKVVSGNANVSGLALRLDRIEQKAKTATKILISLWTVLVPLVVKVVFDWVSA